MANKREYDYVLVTHDLLLGTLAVGGNLSELRALYAIAERLEALVEAVDIIANVHRSGWVIGEDPASTKGA